MKDVEIQKRMAEIKKWEKPLPGGRKLARIKSDGKMVAKLCGQPYGSATEYKTEIETYKLLQEHVDESGTLTGLSFHYNGTDYPVHIPTHIVAGWSTTHKTGVIIMPNKGLSLHCKRLNRELENFGKDFHKKTGLHHGNLRAKNVCWNEDGICVIDFETTRFDPSTECFPGNCDCYKMKRKMKKRKAEQLQPTEDETDLIDLTLDFHEVNPRLAA